MAMEKLTCQDCGLEWEREAKGGTKPKWCGRACKSRRYREENRETASERARQYRKENRGEISERRRRRYEENRETESARNRRYREENREKVLEYARRYREENPEKVSESLRRSREKNPERVRQYRQARRARLADALDEVFPPVEVYERDGWVCGICGEPVDANLKHPNPLSPSLDHIVPLALGGRHSRANTQLAHLVCNVRKGAREAS